MSSGIRLGIIGNGNAGNFFASRLNASPVEVFHFSRNPKQGQIPLSNLDSSFNLDLVFLAVSDQQIKSVSKTLEVLPSLIVHLSGTTPLSELDKKHKNTAVFWPLMSLSNQTKTPLQEIPFCLEASNSESRRTITNFCEYLSLKSQWTDYQQRLKLHLAAVISQNFSNHLFHLAHELLAEDNLDLELFKPILLETVNRINESDPSNFQTGPAKRKDENTINRHLELLSGSKKEIYKIISQSIKETHERKL